MPVPHKTRNYWCIKQHEPQRYGEQIQGKDTYEHVLEPKSGTNNLQLQGTVLQMPYVLSEVSVSKKYIIVKMYQLHSELFYSFSSLFLNYCSTKN